jgi:hypothetical protein
MANRLGLVTCFPLAPLHTSLSALRHYPRRAGQDQIHDDDNDVLVRFAFFSTMGLFWFRFLFFDDLGFFGLGHSPALPQQLYHHAYVSHATLATIPFGFSNERRSAPSTEVGRLDMR